MKLKATLLSLFVLFLFAACEEENHADWKILNDKKFALETQNVKYTKSDNGLLFEILYPGNMKQANVNSYVVVKYKGTLASGKIFDEGTYNGYLSSTIRGWQQTVPLLRIGGKMNIVVPQELAYGKNGSGVIPPYSMLYFEIELLEAYN